RVLPHETGTNPDRQTPHQEIVNYEDVGTFTWPPAATRTRPLTAHILAGALVAFATYDPYDKRDLSFILQEIRDGRVREATLIDNDQRISVTKNDGRQWYADFGPPGLSETALMEELSKADPLGHLKVTVVGSSWG
ncbi:hypothetical protein, partial [Nonomuraea sp. NEAU-A123]|uniref:hypothetical protein n=1 Tax=Nonomuraea sp. NEAU-A123 TaxID=2839649 RepID=UPI001BE3DCFA